MLPTRRQKAILEAIKDLMAESGRPPTLSEIARLLDSFTEKELHKSKQMARGRIQLRMEDTRSVAGWLGSQELLLNEILTMDDVCTRIDAVTRDDVVRVGRALLQPSVASLAAVGPFDSHVFAGLL